MAHAVRELMDTAPGHQMSFEEKLGLVVGREWSERDNRRLSRRLKEAKLATRASLDNVLCDAERGIDKATMRGLSSCGWIKSKHNVIVVGKTFSETGNAAYLYPPEEFAKQILPRLNPVGAVTQTLKRRELPHELLRHTSGWEDKAVQILRRYGIY